MLAQTFGLAATLMPPAPSARRSSPALTRHLMLQPQWSFGERDDGPEMHSVWRPLHGVPEGNDSLLTMRHLAVHALQLRAAQLLQGHAVPHGMASELFLGGGFDHVYVDGAEFVALADESPECRISGPMFYEPARRWLVIDCSRFFKRGSDTFTTAAIGGLVSLAASPRLTAALGAQLRRTGKPANAPFAVSGLASAAEHITRHVLGEPGLDLAGDTQQLAFRVGSRRVARALLGGAMADVLATVEAFTAILAEEQPESQG